MSDYPKFQWSTFVKGRSEQYVIRAETLDELNLWVEEIQKLNEPEQDIAENVTCPIHKVVMQHYVKGQEEWWSHQIGDKWCNGKDNKTNRNL